MTRAEWFDVEGVGPGRLALAPRPRAGDWLREELEAWLIAGFEVIVCLLETDEIQELDLNYERIVAEQLGMRFLHLPIPDRGLPPDARSFDALAIELAGQVEAGRGILCHCRQGIGRSGLLVARILVALGHTPLESWERVANARGRAVPDTDAQRRFLLGA